MAKAPKQSPKKHPEEEYTFVEEEQPPLIEEPEVKRRFDYQRILKNRKIMAVIGIIIAIIIVYQFLNRSAPVTTSETAALTEAGQQPLSQATPETGLPSSPVAATPAPAVIAPVTGTGPAATVRLETALTEQEQQVIGVNRQVQQNQFQIQQLQNNIQQLQDSVNQLNNRLVDFNNRLVPTSAPGAPPIVKTSVVTVTPLPPKYPNYTVRAIVPGRAWLQVKVNRHVVKIVSVAVGDMLPGYGRIEKMSVAQGKVWTSSGKVILWNDKDEIGIRL